MKLIQLSESAAYAISQPNLVVGSSMIYDETFELCYQLNNFDPSLEYLPEEVARRIRRSAGNAIESIEFEFLTPPKNVITVDATTVPFNLIHPYNYFHFLIDALPSLFFLINSKFIDTDHVIVSGILHPNMHHALALVTNNRFQLLQLNLHNAIKASKAVVAQDSFSGNELISGKMPDNFNYNNSNLLSLRSFFEAYLQSSAILNDCKLLVIRQSTQRNILNSDELIAAAEARGFLIVYPERLSFLQQIELFYSASTIVGPSGAWLANLLFVRKDTKVGVLYPETCRSTTSIWKGLGDIFEIPVIDYYFSDYSLNAYQPIHSDFTVDIDVFIGILDGK